MTLLDDARRGPVAEVDEVARAEGVEPETLRRSLARGRVVIPRNAAGRARPLGIGEGLRVKLCPPSSKHGLSVVFWCETGDSICPGMYVTIGGVEKTCFYRPCDDWRNCR